MSISMIIATQRRFTSGNETSAPLPRLRALEPVVGRRTLLFGVGLLGATLLAGAILPLATAYAVSEAFGVPKGVNLDFRRGKIFLVSSPHWW